MVDQLLPIEPSKPVQSQPVPASVALSNLLTKPDLSLAATIKAVTALPPSAQTANQLFSITLIINGQEVEVGSDRALPVGEQLTLRVLAEGKLLVETPPAQATISPDIQQLISQGLRSALPQQDSVIPLLLNLLKVLSLRTESNTLTKLILPKAIQDAIDLIIKQIPHYEPTLPNKALAALIQQSIQRSGVFFEASLTQPSKNSSSASLATFKIEEVLNTDFKANLLKIATLLTQYSSPPLNVNAPKNVPAYSNPAQFVPVTEPAPPVVTQSNLTPPTLSLTTPPLMSTTNNQVPANAIPNTAEKITPSILKLKEFFHAAEEISHSSVAMAPLAATKTTQEALSTTEPAPPLNLSLPSTLVSKALASVYSTPANINTLLFSNLPHISSPGITIEPEDPLDLTLSILLRQVAASLARVEVHQLNTLSQQITQPNQAQQWLLEIPFFYQGHVDVFQLWIEKDKPDKTNTSPKDAQWKITLAFDLESLGPLYAQVSVMREAVTATFWAEKSTTLPLLQSYQPQFEQKLKTLGLPIKDIECFNGKPNITQTRLQQQLVDVKT
jgi:hypothetical protein